MAGQRGRPRKDVKVSNHFQKTEDQITDNAPTPKKAKVQKMIIVPFIKRKSGYQYEGTNSFLDTTHRTWIPSTDTIQLPEDVEGVGSKGDRAEIRFIRGYDNPYVVIQNKIGIKPSPDKDLLFIEDGFKSISKSGLQGMSEWNYISICNYNADNENRFEDTAKKFKLFSSEADAAAYIDIDEKLFNAKSIVYELKTGQDEYNHQALKFYQRVFGLSGSTDVEIFKSFVLLANQKPDLVIEGIVAEKAAFLEIVTRAFEQNLIVVDEIGILSTRRKQYILNTDQQVSRAIAEEKLLEFFASERGSTEYHILKDEVGEFAEKEIN